METMVAKWWKSEKKIHESHSSLITEPLGLNSKQDEDDKDDKLNFHISVHYASSFIFLISLLYDVKKLGFFSQDTDPRQHAWIPKEDQK